MHMVTAGQHANKRIVAPDLYMQRQWRIPERPIPCIPEIFVLPLDPKPTLLDPKIVRNGAVSIVLFLKHFLAFLALNNPILRVSNPFLALVYPKFNAFGLKS